MEKNNIQAENKSETALRAESDTMKKLSNTDAESKVRGMFTKHGLDDDIHPDMQNLEQNRMHEKI